MNTILQKESPSLKELKTEKITNKAKNDMF